VQYSVFECQLRPRDFKRLRERLKPLLEPKEDDVRFYRLCASCLPRALVWSRRQRKSLPEAVVV
jgi:CRISPR-associated protein Cas2